MRVLLRTKYPSNRSNRVLYKHISSHHHQCESCLVLESSMDILGNDVELSGVKQKNNTNSNEIEMSRGQSDW